MKNLEIINLLVKNLNSEKEKFKLILNSDGNSYFHIADIYFKVKKQEMYLGDNAQEMVATLEIVVHRIGNKNKNHIWIDINNTKSVDKLFDWYLSKEVYMKIIECISNLEH